MFKLSHILLNPKKAERHPFEMAIIGFFYTSLSMFLSVWIFPEYGSLVMVFFTVISCLYVVQGTFIVEERKEKDYNPEDRLMWSHARVISFLMFLFVGFLIAYALWAAILPKENVENIFKIQMSSLEGIKKITGNSVFNDYLPIIISNNLKVLFFSLIFSVFYGAGAIFILAWNASIMGLVIGTIIRNLLNPIYIPAVFTKYFLHGLPEMAAYFVAALAGGILFVSLLKGDFNEGRTKRIIIDTALLIILSIVLVIISALIEVYVSARI